MHQAARVNVLAAIAALLVLCSSVPARAQTASPDPYTPITSGERAKWIVEGSIGPRSLATGAFTSTWGTAINSPHEWERTWSGFGKRFGDREARVTISNSLEGGLGAIWGEDPRYGRLGRGGLWPRARHALKSSVLARRRDGQLAPAWGRYVGDVASTAIARTWLPPSATSAVGTTWSITNSVLGRMVGNAFAEFWPDARQLLKK